MNLLLAAVDVTGPLRWRWELRNETTGEVIARHDVSLDREPDSGQAAAFGDLREYVRWNADPLWRDDEPRIVAKTGMWAREAVLGEAITDAIVAAAPVTVLVSAPAPADQVLLWPLELAFADGAPLAARGDVSFVYRLGRSSAVREEGAGQGPEPRDLVPGTGPREPGRPLRVLAAFSAPAGAAPNARRRARHELEELVRRITDRDGAPIELKVLQYGVTRQRLREVMGTGGGWDVVHLAGHGFRARFLLERADRSRDDVSTADLADLLRPAQGRLKLVVLACCMSAAETSATDPLRLLGVRGGLGGPADKGIPADRGEPGPEAAPDRAAGQVTGLARGLAEELGCAVVATRYTVSDEFTIAFDRVFYDRMLRAGDPAGRASARALAAVLAGAPAGGTAAPLGIPAASLGVFGASAVSLVLRAAPSGRKAAGGSTAGGEAAGGERGTPVRRLAGFPAQPERLAGRHALMTAASTALRPGSGTTAVLLHGMPGIGKSACALELAYLCQDQFGAAAFWRPPAGGDPDLVLLSLAGALRQQLGASGAGFPSPPRWGRRRWDTYARRLRENMRGRRVLVVIDNLEELLSPDGNWLDPRWEAVAGALAAHGGESRLVAASRFAPVSLTGTSAGTLLLPVGPLPAAEATVLARELPALRALMYDGQSPALRVIHSADGWLRVRQALDRVQGHPALLELDDAALSAPAAPPDRAERERTEQERAERVRAEQTRVERTIGEWAAATLAALPAEARLMACFVAGLERRDRRLPVIDGTWAGLWRRLDRPAGPPDPGPLLDRVSAAMLTGPEEDQAGPGCQMHPVVAAAIRLQIPAGVRDAADEELGAYWRRDGTGAGAALAALPYLARRRDWDGAVALLDAAIRDDVLGASSDDGYRPALREVARATSAPVAGAALALATRSEDQAGARRLLEESLGGADSAGDDALTWLIAGHLADALRDAGHLTAALNVVVRREGYARAAGLGPWTRLAGQGKRLALLASMERYEQVITEMIGVRERMRRLTEQDTIGELPGIVGWAVREHILRTGRSCAVAFRKWQEALDIGAEIQDSQRLRGASRHALAVTRFPDVYPLIRLRRLTEAARLLVECQQVFEDAGDTVSLSNVFAERADLEDRLGHPDDAVRYARTALRLSYAQAIPAPRSIAIDHENLARTLGRVGAPPEQRQAHWLAAGLLYRLGGMDPAADDLMRWTPPGLRGPGPGGRPGAASPHRWTLAEVIDAAEKTSGVHLAELITAIEPEVGAVTRTLNAILDLAAGQRPAVPATRAWGRRMFAELGGYELATDPAVAALVDRFRRWLEPPASQER